LHREGFVSLFSHLHGGGFVSLSGWSLWGFERLYKTYITSTLSMQSCDNLAPRVVVRICLLENHGYQIQAAWTLTSMFGWASGVGFESFRIQSSVFHSRKITESWLPVFNILCFLLQLNFAIANIYSGTLAVYLYFEFENLTHIFCMFCFTQIRKVQAINWAS
jgi:hypothetical protein